MIERSSSTISKWEKGDQLPEIKTHNQLSLCLGFPAAWFLKPVPSYGDFVTFFRSNASVTKEAQRIALIRLKWLNETSHAMQQWIDWPSINLPVINKTDHKTISDEEIERIALQTRECWKLGLGPISDVLLAMENAGIICTREELGFSRMDGASRWFETDQRPYVFLAADKANGVRSRFDAAHELAHLILHKNVDGPEFFKRHPELERQAHLFASAFLLPAESFAAEITRPSLDTFVALKPRWKVSIAAMIMRCRQLGIVDESYATRLWKNYSARGWRKGEPIDDQIPFEPARLLPRAVDLVVSRGGLTKESVLSAVGLSPTDSESLCGLPAGYFSRQTQAASIHQLKIKRVDSDQHRVTRENDGKVIPFPDRH
ncbi:ImmA/IrrE family metallo-endopeptidase [Rhabdochromatium marinum]|uniref:ImmA/IrrE family metallo-endopeptidase n=1 Tax=Rhabdochromatium marinum TaxID=48729 RepID=UPI00190591BC|nr:ImmA/IrrE family metallo-endopeptidase [Rhabdochromatium marinum]